MKLRLNMLIGAAAAAALLYALPAAADDEVWNNSFRLGLYSIFYHSKADDLSGPYVPAGANLKANDVETLYVAYVRRLSSAFELELAVGYPPLTKVEGRGPATVGSVPYNGQTLSTARWLSPTLLIDYKFLSESSRWRPYIGVGVNYTTFYDRNSTAQGNAASGGPTRLSLTSSVGPAGTVGLSYNVSGHWHVYTSYSISRVNTDLTADTGGVTRTTRIKFGPQAWVVSAGYSF
ncbi:MAG: outer membrane protein [Gammaproteobacteria bacterium]|jgi:outer membrane protein|nr:outer membrane protein [Gammaproteobacteria bacterium]